MKKDSLSETARRALEIVEETSKMYKELAEETRATSLEVYKDTGTLQSIKDATELGLLDSLKTETSSSLAELYPTGPSTIQLLQDSFGEMAKPEYYLGYDLADRRILDEINLATKYGSGIDTTWLRDINAWNIEKDAIAELDLSRITGIPSRFSELCQLEQEVSKLDKIPESITSTASQIASIVEALEEQQKSWIPESREAISQLLDDYSNLATKQYEQILKASEEESKWRLGVIEAASRYVDRQVTWSYQLADRISEEEVVETDDIEQSETEESALPLLPSHIGYTRRVDKTPVKGLEESSITSITEKGKAIADNILTINKLRLDKGKDRIFGLSEKIVGGMLGLSSTVCSTADHLGNVVDILYCTFYENIKHIKILIGHGSETKGDQMVRDEEVYQCIFDVKTIRNDLRHDLDHGNEKEARKKMKDVGECYQKYCGNRPLKPKDFKHLQEKVYDNILKLEEALIQISCEEV